MKMEHTAFNVKEPVLMARWYVEHLGLTVQRRTVDAPYAHFLADDGGTVMIEIYGNTAAPAFDFSTIDPAAVHLAFVSEDVAADENRLVKAGATIVNGVHNLGDDQFSMLRDPWGLPLQLVKRGKKLLEV